MGDSKWDRYGEMFLKIIRNHIQEYNIDREVYLSQLSNEVETKRTSLLERKYSGVTDTMTDTLNYFRDGMKPEEISVRRELKLNTIYSHLNAAIESRIICYKDVIKLSEDEIQDIKDLMWKLEKQNMFGLKAVKDALSDQYDYGILDCVRADIVANGS